MPTAKQDVAAQSPDAGQTHDVRSASSGKPSPTPTPLRTIPKHPWVLAGLAALYSAWLLGLALLAIRVVSGH